MKISVLSENTAVSPQYLSEHGLSLFVESNNSKILFDTGASDNFAINAKKMNIDLTVVDCAFISHGHYDHGGGIADFLCINSKAKVFIDKNAFDERFSIGEDALDKYIGLDLSLSINNRLVFLDKSTVNITDNIISFRTKKKKSALPIANSTLLRKTLCGIKKDDFRDERSLLIQENDKAFLFAGCAHRGIANIISQAKRLLGHYPDYVIGGFHLNGKSVSEPEKNIQQLAKHLAFLPTKFFTCHCTGVEEYKLIKKILKEKIEYISCGEIIKI